jgi:hypothetical protein
MWALINKRAMLRQQGKLPQKVLRLIGQQILAGLKGDRRQQAVDMAEAINKHLAGGETKEAWRCLKGWYKTASKSAPAASPILLAAQTAKHVTLYGRVPSPGVPLPIHVDKAHIPDGPPSNQGTAVSCSGTSKWTCPWGVWAAGRAHQGVVPQCHKQGGGGW